MDKKKYHLRIFRHEELDLLLLTISDHGKLNFSIEFLESSVTQILYHEEVKNRFLKIWLDHLLQHKN